MAMIRSAWAEWAVDRGLDRDAVLAEIHRTAYELLARFAPSSDPAIELRWIGAHQAAYEASIAAFAGARELLDALPEGAWAIVTSARREVSARHLRAAGLPAPRVFICAEDTPRGKPDPAGFMLAAQQLGADARECLAVEDAPAGVRAAREAGMFVLAVTTTHGAEELREANAVVTDLRAIGVTGADGRLTVTFREAS